MKIQPRKLETHINWRSRDVADEATWTVLLDEQDQNELHQALYNAKNKSSDLLNITKEDFPLSNLAKKIDRAEVELIDGRGFVRFRGLKTSEYADEELTLMYWGIGIHLGDPWPQNKHGHIMGDVTDQGKKISDPSARGNEIGLVPLSYHTDGADLVGLMCLRAAKVGGLSCIANSVEIYNTMVEECPELVAELFDALPWDFRGEQPPGGLPFHMRPVFTEFQDRIFCRYIPQYIKSSQRHEEAPRLSKEAIRGLDLMMDLASDPQFSVFMELRPGDIQFVNNYHVLHGRTEYEDDVENGYKRHLKRLWLRTRHLKERPPGFEAKGHPHWHNSISVSNIQAL